MRVIEIVAEHLRSRGFDGLFNGDAECGCEIGDLEPCMGGMSGCEPGYKRQDPSGEPGDWIICQNAEQSEPKAGGMTPEALPDDYEAPH